MPIEVTASAEHLWTAACVHQLAHALRVATTAMATAKAETTSDVVRLLLQDGIDGVVSILNEDRDTVMQRLADHLEKTDGE